MLVCHHGSRSQHAAQWLARNGFAHVHNLRGGVEAWALDVDPAMPATDRSFERTRGGGCRRASMDTYMTRTRTPLIPSPSPPAPSRCARGGAASGEDLLQIYREAQKSDPAIAAARSQWEATQERVPQARSALLPPCRRTRPGEHQQLRLHDQHRARRSSFSANYS